MGKHRGTGTTPDHDNLLLAALPAELRTRLLSLMTVVPLEVRDTLYLPGAEIDYVYFPLKGVMSIVTVLEDGVNVEAAIVGDDGLLGSPLILGVGTSFHHVFCQMVGSALRLPAAVFRKELEDHSSLRELCLRYAQAMINQMSQFVACANRHSVRNRFARWLLFTQDRIGSDELEMTQDFLALMLGVRRATVTAAARAQQKAGLIRYNRGRITILDRIKLEAAACECYRVVRDELDRVTE